MEVNEIAERITGSPFKVVGNTFDVKYDGSAADPVSVEFKAARLLEDIHRAQRLNDLRESAAQV